LSSSYLIIRLSTLHDKAVLTTLDSPYTKTTFGGLVVWVPLDSVTTLVEVEAPKAGKAAPGR